MMEQFDYKRDLNGITELWHKIVVPDELFGKVSQNLSDIRIFGITASNDTVEAPYLMQLATEKISRKEIAFKTLNASHNNKGYYFTFEIPTAEPINQIKLEFKQQNFDWRVKLEGSENRQEWFTVIENYRILSIKNELTDFQFTNLTFPNSKYRYFRLLIDSRERPELIVASIARQKITDGKFRNYPIRKIKTENNKQTRQTEIDIELQLPVRVSHVKIRVADGIDYYRTVIIKCLTDSIKTEQGWKYNYNTLTSGTLNSIEKNEFNFSSSTIQRLKIFIHHHDNQPLNIDTIQVKGYVHELVVRFTEQAEYFLTYGNKRTGKPHYDIDRFIDKIPQKLAALKLGDELPIKKEKISVTEPLFKNKTWLWAIMAIIIFLLGWFTIKMLRKK
jgi:hypothetical protein